MDEGFNRINHIQAASQGRREEICFDKQARAIQGKLASPLARQLRLQRADRQTHAKGGLLEVLEQVKKRAADPAAQVYQVQAATKPPGPAPLPATSGSRC